jgi:pilus assembly protein CpaF
MSLLKRVEKGQRSEAIGSSTKLEELGLRRLPSQPVRDAYYDLKTRVQSRLIRELDPGVDVKDTEEVRSTIQVLYDAVLSEEGVILSRSEKNRLFEQIAAEILGLGPIEPLLQDETITEIMVNGPGVVYVERDGVIEETDLSFESDEHVQRIIDRIVSPLGRRIDESSPYVKRT